MKKWLLAGVFGTGLLMAGLLGVFALMGNTPDFEGKRGVKIPRSATFAAVVDSLTAGGLLQNRASFVTLASLTGWRRQIKAGYYTFEAGASNYTLLNTLRKGLQSPIRLTIPPGTRPSVLAAVLAKEMTFSRQEVLAALKDPAFARELGTDTTHLFGYMLPETYFFYWLTDARTVLRKVQEAAEQYLRKRLPGDGVPQGLNPDQVLNLAAIVEWEAHLEDEKPRIAGVYLNRLRAGWPLQADPTVQYALLQIEGQKRRLLFRDYQIDHPYNTYRVQGLPPGPITNPSPTSIQAVLNPEQHDYFYFVAKGDGGHIFSRTLAEHNRAAEAYYALMRQRRAEQQP
jgi:UPF0755 protein